MMKVDKKQIKIVSLVVAVFFILGIAGLAVSQSGSSGVVNASGTSNVGVVNHDMLVSQHPDMAKAQETMQAEIEQAKKEFETKSANMNEKEKQDYYTQLQQRLSLKQQELLVPIFDKVTAAIKAVADAKGLTVVIDKSNVVYGGQDITDEVAKKISGK